MALDSFKQLEKTMQTLRSESGCPWDRAQTLESLKPFLIEEAYEVLDAIDSNNVEEHLEELGDLLFQIVFQSQIRSEQGEFCFDDVAACINEKMLRRHPHVFGDTVVNSTNEVTQNWDALKQAERSSKSDSSRFAGIPKSAPALLRAQRLGEKAAKFGLDWNATGSILAKLNEELSEFQDAYDTSDSLHQTEEFGDLLFTLVNISRHLNIDAESALQLANQKFERRARYVESAVATSDTKKGPEEIDRLWVESKTHVSSI
ncbi:MAG: nucleoside triphosphate pyrophosphohydrolase [Bradymonadia bacterium]